MPGQSEALSLEKSKTNYLNQDRSVNLQKHLDKQDKIKKSGLEGIEIRDRAKQLGKDDFLQLLVKQLTHQDPTSPIKDQAFIAQMAQFSSLEQMQNMASSINQLSDRQATNLVGKFIMAKDFVSGQPVTGIAQALFFDNTGQAFIKVSGKNVSIKDITLIGDPKNFKREFGGTATGRTPASQPAAPHAGMQAPGQQMQRMQQPANTPAANGLNPAASAAAAANAASPAPGAQKAGLPAASNAAVNQTKSNTITSGIAAERIMNQAVEGLAPAANPATESTKGVAKDGAVPAKATNPAAPVGNTNPAPAPEEKPEKPVSFMEMIHSSSDERRAFQA